MPQTPATPFTNTPQSHKNGDHHVGEEELDEKLSQECKDLIITLPREKWGSGYLYLFQGFWCRPTEIQGITLLQNHLQAKDSDTIVASFPKSGTTWLKALTFAIVNRKRFSPSSDNHPLLHSNSHDLIPFLEYQFDADPDLSSSPEPRLFSTHMPFNAMPSSTKNSGCKIIYICRNPFDNFVSFWIFLNKTKMGSIHSSTFEEAFDMYCKGLYVLGPYWDHLLSYWNESKERPDKVLFLKYEDLKVDTRVWLKRIGEFLGCPFSLEEEERGEIDGIIELCSFNKMKELEVNKSGRNSIAKFENKHFFRKAEIGDWVNHLSPSMVERLSKIIHEKFAGSGLSFKVSP